MAIAVASFFVSYVAELVDAMQPLRYASVFYYNGGAKAITEGVDALGFAVLLALTCLFTGLGLRAFNRRDLSTRGGSSLLTAVTSLFTHRKAEAAS